MSRFARDRRVFFLEEPLFEDAPATLRCTVCPQSGVRVYTPILPVGTSGEQVIEAQRELLRQMMSENAIEDYTLWYYTPMARQFTMSLKPRLIVYDCMDELSAFAGAPAAMRNNEQALFREADLVFTGGASLYETKRTQHPSVHLFPSSVDVDHFAQARTITDEPADQIGVARPRLGYAGVIDERMDLELLREVAAARPNWQLILLGPVVKIDPSSLPRAENIHYLGMKSYAELPAYLSGWNIGMLPFALNEATRFISPTKTPEYLAAGLAVISTPIRDVVNTYGDLGLVGIAATSTEFVNVAESLLTRPTTGEFRTAVDSFLGRSSWEKTWAKMNNLMEEKSALKYLTIRDSKPTSGVKPVTKGAAHV